MDKSNLWSYFTYVFGAFSVLSTIVSLADSKYQSIVIVLTILFALIASFAFIKSKKHDKTMNVIKSLNTPNSGEMEVRGLIYEGELKKVWDLDVESFADSSVPFKTGKKWWEKYSSGVYGLFSADQVLGYVSFWPLTKTAYNKFKAGILEEGEITIRSINPPKKDDKESFWFIGSILLNSNFRKTLLIKKLINDSVALWLSDFDDNHVLNVAALAYSTEGANILKRFGFLTEGHSADKLTVYSNKIKCKDLKAMIADRLK